MIRPFPSREELFAWLSSTRASAAPGLAHVSQAQPVTPIAERGPIRWQPREEPPVCMSLEGCGRGDLGWRAGSRCVPAEQQA
jgi:hypothetical protein